MTPTHKISLKPGNMLNPTPVVMVSCGETPDEYNIITVAWTGTLCSDPPMCYISVDQLLHTEEGQTVGLSYFKERGFTQQTIEKFKLGYCPDGWDKFTQEALKNGYQLEHLIMTGLTKKAESGKVFDFYRGRVIFPIYDKLGKPVGFGGRILKKDEKIAKYFNSPESPIYHKSNVLYGFYQAQRTIKSKDNVYLVEGYTDVLSMVQAGIENVVATSGTAFPDGQIRLLKSKTNNVTVLRDGDRAGINAALKDINILLGNGFNVSVVMLPDGEDPDSFAQSHRDSEITDYLHDNADSFIMLTPSTSNPWWRKASWRC